jgi:hypothetical protein
VLNARYTNVLAKAIPINSTKECHTIFRKHTPRFAWHIERISTDEGMSGATFKTSSYCVNASSYFASTKSLFPSAFASFA